MAVCKVCGKTLSGDEVAVNRRMISRAAVEFWCKDCLAKEWDCEVAQIEEKIEYFRKSGCTLFAKS